ncbi:IS110 family transposase, partial [Candidatus Accumulibacter phosphatis]|nr:IS110 family transposase [Candidatus Accumulibacter contiguus]
MNASESTFVGIDVSKDTLEIALDDQSKTQCIANADADIAALVKELVPRSEEIGAIVLE